MSKTTKTFLRNTQWPPRLQVSHLEDALENPGVGPLSWMVEIWKLICSLLDVSLGHPPCQKPQRLLSGTTSVLLDSRRMLWRHIGDEALPRKVEIWKLECSFLDVSLRHPYCQKPPRLLSGTSCVLQDSKDDTWRTQECLSVCLLDFLLVRAFAFWSVFLWFLGLCELRGVL